MSVDRRKRKTRDALRNALSDLIEEKTYNKITVQELAEHANVSRSSFYLHFRDNDDLLLSGFSNSETHSLLKRLWLCYSHPHKAH